MQEEAFQFLTIDFNMFTCYLDLSLNGFTLWIFIFSDLFIEP
jgi:hypothetical protein